MARILRWDFRDPRRAIPCFATTDFLCDLGQVIKCFGKAGLVVPPPFYRVCEDYWVTDPFVRGSYKSKYNIKQHI